MADYTISIPDDLPVLLTRHAAKVTAEQQSLDPKAATQAVSEEALLVIQLSPFFARLREEDVASRDSDVVASYRKLDAADKASVDTILFPGRATGVRV